MADRVLLIVNPAAAAGRDQLARLARVERSLRQRGSKVDSKRTLHSGHATVLAADAARSGSHGVVVAVGGDGTAREVATGLLAVEGSPVVFGVAPFGTGNDVSVELGTATDAALVEAIGARRIRCWDAIEVQFQGERGAEVCHALLLAACGFAVELLRQTTPAVKRWFGSRLCYPVGFFRALPIYRPVSLRVQSGDVDLAGRWMHVCAANAARAGGRSLHHAPGARPDDGQLDICLIQQLHWLEPAWQFPRVVRGTHVKDPRVRFFRGSGLELQGERPAAITVDGDVIGTTPARFQVRTGALRVVCGGNP